MARSDKFSRAVELCIAAQEKKQRAGKPEGRKRACKHYAPRLVSRAPASKTDGEQAAPEEVAWEPVAGKPEAQPDAAQACRKDDMEEALALLARLVSPAPASKTDGKQAAPGEVAWEPVAGKPEAQPDAAQACRKDDTEEALALLSDFRINSREIVTGVLLFRAGNRESIGFAGCFNLHHCAW